MIPVFGKIRGNMFLRRLLLLALVGASLYQVGCATDVGQRWAYTHQPLPARVVYSSGEALQIMCRALDSARFAVYFGCVERDYASNTCWIYVEPNPPAWLIHHERRHCEGWSHD